MCLCHWIKLYLMALFWETRSMRLVLGEHPLLSTQNTSFVVFSRWASLPKTKPCQGMPPSICQKLLSSDWLLFMVSCYRASLLMLAPGTSMHFHHTRSSPALSSDVVSIRLWPMFLKSCCTNRDPLGGAFLYFNKIRARRRVKWTELGGVEVPRCGDCHLPLHSTAF